MLGQGWHEGVCVCVCVCVCICVGVERYLGCFQFLAIIKKGTVNMVKPVSLW